MAFFNPKKQSMTDTTSHKNWMGGNSWDIKNPLVRLRVAATSCFFGEPMYYHETAEPTVKKVNSLSYLSADAKQLRETLGAEDPQEWRTSTPAQLLETAIDDALNFDAEKTLQFACDLRNIEHMRTTPQVILVRAAHNPKIRGTGLVRKYSSQIVQRADEPAVGLAYHLYAFKDKAVPNALKKAWRKSLETFSEYDLAKYRLSSHKVKTVDVVNLVHPKSEVVSKLVKGELTTENKTWESIISKEGSTKEAWEKAIDVAGHMAMLRNVRNFLTKGVDPSLFVEKLIAGAAKGKQLPFRYYSAYNAVKGQAPGNVLDAIEKCLNVSLNNLPKFKGRTMCLCDNSGSAQSATTSSMGTMKVSTIANLTGILASMCSDDGYLGVFGDKLEEFAVRKTSSVFDQLDKAEKLADGVGMNTENGIWLFLDRAIKNKEHWDNIFVMSDMQAGHGGLYGTHAGDYSGFTINGRYIDVAKLINKYRTEVNPNVNVFLIQVAGYQDTIIPEFYNKTYILGGWSDSVLKFAAKMIEITTPVEPAAVQAPPQQ
jgi:hypothetical protein